MNGQILLLISEDDAREMRIRRLALRLQTAATITERCAAWSGMQSEILARSEGRIRQMERERGLS